jgi:predicted HicB family RNase H-like nuclease
MVNINIEIPDELHRRLKISSTLDEKTLKQYVIDALAAEAQKDVGGLK